MSGAAASRGDVKVKGILRDRHGNPKINYKQVERFWPWLSRQDRVIVCRMHPNHPYCKEE